MNKDVYFTLPSIFEMIYFEKIKISHPITWHCWRNLSLSWRNLSLSWGFYLSFDFDVYFIFSKVTLTLVEPILESNNRVHLISDLWGRTYIRHLDIYPVHIELWRHQFCCRWQKLKPELILSPIWIWRVLIFYPVRFYWCYNLPIF